MPAPIVSDAQRQHPSRLQTEGVMGVLPGTDSRRRHLRKYAEGRLGEDRSFYFRGPDGRLNLRAQQFDDVPASREGVGEDTWSITARAATMRDGSRR